MSLSVNSLPWFLSVNILTHDGMKLYSYDIDDVGTDLKKKKANSKDEQ